MSVPDVTLDLVGALALRAHSTYRHALLLREYDEAGVEVGSLPTRQYALTGGGEGLVLELRSSPAGALLATDKNFASSNHFANILEADRGFVNLDTMVCRHSIKQMRRGDRAGQITMTTTA